MAHSPDGLCAAHVHLLRTSLRRCSGIDLVSLVNAVDLDASMEAVAEGVWNAPFALLSHDTSEDPVFTYGNAFALDLFEMSWEDFTRLPSRMSAEPLDRSERQILLDRVQREGFVDDYSGIRISSGGKRFRIEDALVWNLTDEDGVAHGQAALIRRWVPLVP